MGGRREREEKNNRGRERIREKTAEKKRGTKERMRVGEGGRRKK